MSSKIISSYIPAVIIFIDNTICTRYQTNPIICTYKNIYHRKIIVLRKRVINISVYWKFTYEHFVIFNIYSQGPIFNFYIIHNQRFE